MPKPLDEILQHELQIARLATGSINSIIIPSLEDTYKEVLRIIRERGLPNTPKRLEMLERAIIEAINKYNGWGEFTLSLDEFAQYEAGVALATTQAYTNTALTLTASDRIAEYVRTALLSLESGARVNSGTWAQFVKSNIDSQTATYNSIVRTGYARGQTLRQISRNLRTATEGLMRSEAEALARTGYSHYANAAREAMAQGLSIDTDWVYTSTFDSRTTIGCRNLHGTRYKNGKNRIPLPRHFGCRSVYIILPEGEELEGLRPAVGGKSGEEAGKSFDRRAKNKTPKYRGRKDKAFEAELIQSSTPQENWLRRQPRWLVDASLGKKRADLFLNGKVRLSKFTDMTGRDLTLDELRNVIDPKIFDRYVES